MSTQRYLLGTLAGGIVLFFLGYLLHGVLLAGFFAANMGSATGVTREPFDFVSLALGQLVWGAALTTVLHWRGVSAWMDGLKTGATVGLLMFFGIDLTLYGTTNIMNLTGAVADAVVATVLFAVAGAVIAAVQGRKAG
jgi:hypothetical protein